MSDRLLKGLATTEALSAAFSDAAILSHMLRFEAALARAQAKAGLVPPAVAEAIAAVGPDAFDAGAIALASRASGTIAIAFLEARRQRVSHVAPDAARLVHHGATSQDVTDTALVLCLADARTIVDRDHARLAVALRGLSDAHRDTPMLARTLLQPAAATTFGLKVAGWYAGLSRGYAKIAEAFDDTRVLQFGGPVGTLAALGDRGPAIAEAVAGDLDLKWPGAPWHTERSWFAALVSACAVYTGALGKMARDISLLMQFEVGEAAEPGGGSSSMPHKRNPSGCALILAAATRMPGLAATALAALPQEHERGVGGWHAEALTLADAIQTTGSALAMAAEIAEHLTVDPDRMRRNLDATRGSVPETPLGSAETFRRRLLAEGD